MTEDTGRGRGESKDEAEAEDAAEEYEPDRSSEAESAQAYADAGIMGAPGSEVKWPEAPEPAADDDGKTGRDDAGKQASG